MGKQQVKVELFYNGVWNDLVATGDVYTDPPITISHGGGEESAVVKPNRGTLTIANDDDKYRPSNPTSPLYGKVGRNTPCRVSVAGTVRVIGEASFSPDQTSDFRASPRRGVRWVDTDVAGVSQRIGQWTEPLRSAFRYWNDGYTNITGYWPMEDARGATTARSAINGSANTFLFGQSFGSQNSPPGGGTGVDVQAGSNAGFQFAGGNPASTVGWEYSVAVYQGAMDSGAGWAVIGLRTLAGVAISAYVNESAQTLNLIITDAANNSLLNSTYSTGRNFRGRWVLWHCRCTLSGGTVTVGVSWRDVDDPTWVGISGTYAGMVTSDLDTAGMALPPDSTYGHVIGGSGVLNLDSSDRFDAFLGHPGELAGTRFARLCAENGIPYLVSSSYTSSAPMGPQRVDTLPGHFEEIATTDDALIFDDTPGLNLFMLCLADRMSQTPTLTLDATNPVHLSVPPAEVLNDLDPHNIVTASQREGGQYTLEDSSSPMGSQPPPAGVGEYQQTVDVNVDDEVTQLPQVAGWWLAKGTLDEPRFPTVVVDLVAAPSLIPAVEATDVGNVIQLLNYREWPIRMHVLGWSEKVGTHTRTVTFTCALDNVYNPGVLDGPGRLVATSTTLNAAITSTATTLVLKMTNVNEQWRPGNNAVLVVIGGERITLGTVGAVTGTGPWTQTVTGCLRSRNGVVKAQVAGEQVTVYGPLRLTLRVN